MDDKGSIKIADPEMGVVLETLRKGGAWTMQVRPVP
jgi:hypothetical protein